MFEFHYAYLTNTGGTIIEARYRDNGVPFSFLLRRTIEAEPFVKIRPRAQNPPAHTQVNLVAPWDGTITSNEGHNL